MEATATDNKEWAPDLAVHPGIILEEYLAARDLSQADFARIAGFTPKLVSEIITGKNPISPETAIVLERVLGMKAYIWTGIQAEWDLHVARKKVTESASDHSGWLSHFPIKELKARKVLPDTKDQGILCEALLKLLQIGKPEGLRGRFRALSPQYRQSIAHPASQEAIITWLALAERQARKMMLPSYSGNQFGHSVHEIRKLTLGSPSVFQSKMIDQCARAGVALVFEREISKTRLFGAAVWFQPENPMIVMSLRMKTNDHFWWTFFHECGHVMLHQGKNFLDDQDGEDGIFEDQANRWALEILVGCSRYENFRAAMPRSELAVRTFANSVAVHPGIVVGMLQHDHVVPHRNLNRLKERFEWAEEFSTSR